MDTRLKEMKLVVYRGNRCNHTQTHLSPFFSRYVSTLTSKVYIFLLFLIKGVRMRGWFDNDAAFFNL